MPRKLRKQPTARLDSWNMDAEIGDRNYEPQPGLDGSYIYDLRESNGAGKRSAGELTAHVVKKHGRPRIAFLADDGIWYWRD